MEKENSGTTNKKKRKRIFAALWSLLVIGGATGGAVAAAVLIPKQEEPTYVSITYDPVRMSQGDEVLEHLLPAPEEIVLNLAEGGDEKYQELDQGFESGSYLSFNYQISNIGPKDVSWTFDLQNVKNEGFTIEYRVGANGEIVEFNSALPIFVGNLQSGSQVDFFVFLKADGIENLSISGAIVIKINEL